MNAEQIIRVILESRGWTVRTVSADHVPLVDVNEEGLLKCVDGRASDKENGMRGPKMLGGIYAIASMRGVTEASDLADIVEEVRKAGFVPSVHGDGHAHPDSMGCGYFKLWSQGKLKGLTKPQFDSEAGRAAVEKADGVYEMLRGSHYEVQVDINLVAGKTLEPNEHDQRFIVDGWVVGQFGLDVPTYVTLAASTVEQLSTTCRSARIIL